MNKSQSFLSISLAAALLLSGPAMLMADDADKVCPVSYSGRCHFVVCFPDYEDLAARRAIFLKDFFTSLELNQFIPADTGEHNPPACFLEWTRRSTADALALRGLTVRPLSLDEISPTYASQLRRVENGLDPAESLDSEIMIQFRTRSDLDTLQNLFDLTNVSGASQAAVNHFYLGPYFRPEALIDQFKTSLGYFEANLPFKQNTTLTLESLLNRKGVTRIDPAQFATLRNRTTSWVIQSGERENRPAYDCGLSGKGQVIGLIDDLIDQHHCMFDDPGVKPGSNHRKLLRYEPRGQTPGSLHGTFIAGILAGSLKGDPENDENGQAPNAKIAFDSVWRFAVEGQTETLFYRVLERQYSQGARIFSTSWGDDASSNYSLWSYGLDRFLFEHEYALSVIAISNEDSIRNPENSRNALAVGASRQADLLNEKGAGARGPTQDHRRKPEVLAPGCRIRSAEPGSACGNTKAPMRHGHEHSSKEPFHESDCATSWAAPAVAGAAALAREYLGNPSGAMIKAFILNSTEDMPGIVDDDNEKKYFDYPNNTEGWGRIRLENMISATPKTTTLAFDVLNKDGFFTSCPAQAQNYKIKAEAGEDLKVTIVWTDHPPASIPVPTPIVNDLDLRVRQLGCQQGQACLFLGNDFKKTGATSEPRKYIDDDFLDKLNNVERVVTPGKNASYCISVVGMKINAPTQGYALVITGKGLVPLPSAEDCLARSFDSMCNSS